MTASENSALPNGFTDSFAGPDQKAIDAAVQDAMTTTRYTDEEWTKLIEQAEAQIKPSTKKVEAAKDTKAVVKLVDHTLLKLDATPQQIDALCAEARTEEFMSVCVRLLYVRRCAANLKGSSVRIACVVGFHEGTYDTSEKLNEASSAVSSGASELDVVINWPLLKKGAYATIYNELAAIRSLCPHPIVLKLIFETSQLEKKEIVAACHLAAAAKFNFVKTSTGFNGRGASVEDVRLMYAASQFYATAEGRGLVGRIDAKEPPPMKVKASGGVRGMEDAVRMIEAGAERIGTSSGVWIMQEARTLEDAQKENKPVRPEEGVTRLYTDNSVDGY